MSISLHTGRSFGREVGAKVLLEICAWSKAKVFPSLTRTPHTIKQNISELNYPNEEPVCMLCEYLHGFVLVRFLAMLAF